MDSHSSGGTAYTISYGSTPMDAPISYIAGSATYSYEANGNQTRCPVNGVRGYTLLSRVGNAPVDDGLGRKRQMSDPDMGVWQYRYDAAGNLTEQQDARFGQDPLDHPEHDLFFAYDALNRVTAKYYGAAHRQAAMPDVQYYYDDALQDAASAHSWGHVRAAEVTLRTQPSMAHARRYAHDTRGLTVSYVLTTTGAYSSRWRARPTTSAANSPAWGRVARRPTTC